MAEILSSNEIYCIIHICSQVPHDVISCKYLQPTARYIAAHTFYILTYISMFSRNVSNYYTVAARLKG